MATWVVLSVAITANMLLVVPPWAPIAIPLWIAGRVSVIGSGLIVAMTLACLWLLTHDGAEHSETGARLE
jgi:hypothetical protein